MKLSIIGFGQMGQMIRQCAIERGLEVVSTIDPINQNADYREITKESIGAADVCICFTQPQAALDNIKAVCAQKKHLVMGTTGWEDHMESVRALVNETGIGMVYSSNFSIGVNIFFKLIEKAAGVINSFDMYDVLGWEAHHNIKMDSPSGTAKTIANILLENIDRKSTIVEDKLDRAIQPEELHFASMRGGRIPGTHSVLLDSEFDTIELKHTARSRKGFAMGSIVAAEWIVNQKGLFTEADMMQQLIPGD